MKIIVGQGSCGISAGAGKVYDTGGFAASNPEQFDLATDWSNHDGR